MDTSSGKAVRRGTILSTCVAMLCLGGCALSPYVVKDSKTKLPVLSANCANGQSAPSMVGAVAAADGLEQRYHKIADQERRTRSIAVGAAIPLGVIGMYQGATGAGSSRSIAALGLAGAGSYLGAQTFTATPRELVYLAGAKALNCVRRAYAPFESLGTNEFDSAISRHQLALGELSNAIAKQEANQGGGTDDLRLLTYARKVQGTAQDTYTDALRLQREVRQLGVHFCTMIKDISTQVAIEARKTEPEPAAVLASIALLPKIQTSITGRMLPSASVPAAPEAAKLRQPAAAAGTALTDQGDRTELLEKIAAAAHTMAILSAQIAATANPAGSNTQAQACESPQAQITLTITPDVSTLALAEGESYRFTIRSQIGNPTYQIDGGSTASLGAQLLIESGQTVLLVTALKPSGATPASLTIRDGSGALSKSIAVTVAAKPAATDTGNTKSSQCAPRPGEDKSLVMDPAKVKLLQLKLGMPANLQTGCVGDLTRGEIRTFQQKNGLAQDGALTAALWDKVTN
ncbi:MAG: hypothetical protein JNN30_01095 [Rhodanobacteraceae bacterium]|nr:hypothetical protein [Rhodanobacteraceae bacterium]